MERISVSEKTFLDEHGRQRIFNGINLCDKGSYNGVSRDYQYSYDDSLFERFRDLGINIIRLGVTWDAIEPEKGKYNDAYLDAIRGVLDQCDKYGIYAYVDMHQDLYSGFGAGAGDGAPAWACLTDKYKPKPTRFVWAEGYFWGRAVQRAFDSFWDNRKLPDGDGIQDCYIRMWAHVAQKLGDHPALFGFDLMNEPFIGKQGGKVFRKIVASAIRVTLTDKRISRIKLIKDFLGADGVGHALGNYSADVFEKITSSANNIVAKFDIERYSPFLSKAAGAVRDVTDNGIILIENCYYSNLGIPCNAKPITINGKREPKQAFAPHAYDLMVDTELYKYASNDRVGAIFAQRKFEQDTRMNMPAVVGEWGGFSEGTHWLPHVEYLLSLFDSYKWSNTYWAYFDGLLDTPLMGVLHRPYPVAVTGDIISYRHDRNENSFVLTYDQKKEYDAPTQIYAHKAVRAVETDGEYTVESCGKGSIVSVNTAVGKHTVKVLFEGEGFSYAASLGK